MLDFKSLYFAVEPDIADVLTSVGIEVSVGETTIVWAHTFGDLGGEPEALDCTPLASKVRMQKSGLQDQEAWVVDYYYNDTDYEALETLRKAGTSSDVKVKFSDGTTFTNKGVVSANYIGGQSVNGMIEAHVAIDLSNPEGWTKSEAV